MELTMLLLVIATVILAGLSFWAAVHYGRKALTEAKSANRLASERSVVEWQIGRWEDGNPGHFYAANSARTPPTKSPCWPGTARNASRLQRSW